MWKSPFQPDKSLCGWLHNFVDILCVVIHNSTKPEIVKFIHRVINKLYTKLYTACG